MVAGLRLTHVLVENIILACFVGFSQTFPVMGQSEYYQLCGLCGLCLSSTLRLWHEISLRKCINEWVWLSQ